MIPTRWRMFSARHGPMAESQTPCSEGDWWRWRMVWRFLEGLSRLHNNVLYVEPHFGFGAVAADPDDNKFVDCAIAAKADFIVTSDRHFDALHSSGYKPKGN